METSTGEVRGKFPSRVQAFLRSFELGRTEYVRELSESLGGCLLELSVAAGLRKHDGILYCPPLQWAKRGLRMVRQDIRKLKLELEGLNELRQIGLTYPEFNDDPLVLAELACQCAPDSKWSRLNLATNFIRSARAEEAIHALRELERMTRAESADFAERVLRNLGCAFEVFGDPESAHWYAWKAFSRNPGNHKSLINVAIYSLACGGVGSFSDLAKKYSPFFSDPNHRREIQSLLSGVKHGKEAIESL